MNFDADWRFHRGDASGAEKWLSMTRAGACWTCRHAPDYDSSTAPWGKPRIYLVPARLVKESGNILAVRMYIWSFWMRAKATLRHGGIRLAVFISDMLARQFGEVEIRSVVEHAYSGDLHGLELFLEENRDLSRALRRVGRCDQGVIDPLPFLTKFRVFRHPELDMGRMEPLDFRDSEAGATRDTACHVTE